MIELILAKTKVNEKLNSWKYPNFASKIQTIWLLPVSLDYVLN